jgi:squalene-hopene/tetraprenyl-beta-curcumene cyclase
VGLPVVSYALPALIAIGQVRHHFRPTRNPVTWLVRELTRNHTLELLINLQPSNGGFLEATPLTSFVTMSLAAMGLVEHPVTVKGVEFLRQSARADGSWPIDTNLATWLTTLSVNALAHDSVANWLRPEERTKIREWLLGQQHLNEHPYTHAAPGGGGDDGAVALDRKFHDFTAVCTDWRPAPCDRRDWKSLGSN